MLVVANIGRLQGGGLRRVYRTASGQEVTIRHPEYKPGATAWLDHNRFTAWAVRTDRVDLLVCSVSAGSCARTGTTLQGAAGPDPALRLSNAQDAFGPVG